MVAALSALRIGVCGLGSIGSRHARLLAAIDGVEVHGHDTHASADDMAALVSHAPSLAELIERAPDGLIIATPDAVHVEQAAAALRAGVPVLIEKPLSNDLASARSVAALAVETGVPATVGYVLRHHGTMARFRNVIEHGTIGTPVSFHATLSASETLVMARNRFDETSTFGIVYDYSHEWDYVRWLLGPIDRCAATARSVHTDGPSQDPNVVDALFELAGGVTGSVHLDYISTGVRRCRVIGDGGVAELDVGAGSVVVRRDGVEDLVEVRPEDRDVAFRRQLQHFVAIIRREGEPIVTLDDGVRAIAVADAVVKACVEHRWVDVESVS